VARRLPGPILVAACVFAFFGGATPAYACTIDDPSDCPTYSVVHHAVLTVATSRGTITSGDGGIDCPGDCSEDYPYEDFCTDLPGRDECEPGIPADVTLTAANGGAGYSPSWSGCDSAAGSQCDITMDSDASVSASWMDVQDPTVALASPPAKAGPATVFTATAGDNSGVVTKVDFYVDNVLRATDTSAPFQFQPDLGAFADGSAHTLKAISQDGSGRTSSPVTAGFTVDKSTGLTGVTTPAAYTQAAPDISFTAPADATSVICRTKFAGGVTGSTSSCTSPYSPQTGAGTDGEYTIELVVGDDVGNTATITRTFTKDTGAPDLAVSSPASGSTLTSPFTPSVTASDGFTPADQIVVQCQIDSGPFGNCASLAPSDGSHTLTVRATDLAGNAAQQAVPFTYGTTGTAPTAGDAPAGGGGGGGPAGGGATDGGASGAAGGSAALAEPKISAAFKLAGLKTLVKKLTLTNLAPGTKVTLTCRGRGCAFKKLRLTPKTGVLALAPKFKKRKLAAKTVITVVVTTAGKSKTFRYTLRKKAQPKSATR
jgi:hypothetical protein